MQPFLFGSVGATLLLTQIRAGDVGKAFAVLVCGQFTRFFVVLLGSYTPSNRYTFKERLFIASTYMPKSTTVATVASVIYTESLAKSDEYAEYKTWGLQIQTTCILIVVIQSLIGPFLIDFLGPRLLQQQIKVNPNVPADEELKKEEPITPSTVVEPK